MLDNDLFLDFTYGNYIVSTAAPGGALAGAAMNTVFQLTEEPHVVAVSFNHASATGRLLRQTGQAAITVLGQGVDMAVEDLFGMNSSAEVDKFSAVPHALAPNGAPYLTENAVSVFSGHVLQVVELPTHDLFLVEITHAQRLSDQEPMTYALYRQRKAAQAGQDEGTWTCPVCAWEYDNRHGPFPQLPDQWRCPLCAAPGKSFTLRHHG